MNYQVVITEVTSELTLKDYRRQESPLIDGIKEVSLLMHLID